MQIGDSHTRPRLNLNINFIWIFIVDCQGSGCPFFPDSGSCLLEGLDFGAKPVISDEGKNKCDSRPKNTFCAWPNQRSIWYLAFNILFRVLYLNNCLKIWFNLKLSYFGFIISRKYFENRKTYIIYTRAFKKQFLKIEKVNMLPHMIYTIKLVL